MAAFLSLFDYFSKRLEGVPARQVTVIESVQALQNINDYMLKKFGRVDLSLGDVQKLVRGDNARPAHGVPDLLSAAYTMPYINGMRKIISGDAYICLVRYPKSGLPVIESVTTFGTSQHSDSSHRKDQMTMFQNQQTKCMTLDKKVVLQPAERIYHPFIDEKK